MIIDTSFITELYEAEKIDSYDELMKYMIQFDKKFYEKWNIYTQTHHLVPAFECKDLDKETAIQLPVSIHFIAHILRAREWSFSNETEQYAIGNYTEAFCIMRNFVDLRGLFHEEFMEAKSCYQKFFKPATYEAQFGKKKADIIKRRISAAMRNLDPYVISQRNKSIAQYASNRPPEHNAAIANARKKAIVHKSGKVYSCVEDASTDLNISISTIRRDLKNGKNWDYLI